MDSNSGEIYPRSPYSVRYCFAPKQDPESKQRAAAKQERAAFLSYQPARVQPQLSCLGRDNLSLLRIVPPQISNSTSSFIAASSSASTLHRQRFCPKI